MSLDSKIIDNQIERLFSKQSPTEMDLILSILSIIFYKNNMNKDIVDLYNIVDINSFVKIINLFDGKSVKLPTKNNFKEELIFAILYYYKKVKGYEWDKIKQIVDFPINGIKYGIKINSLSDYIKESINKLFEDNNE